MALMTRIKRLTTENWLPKILCLLLAVAVWVVINHGLEEDKSSPYPSDVSRAEP